MNPDLDQHVSTASAHLSSQRLPVTVLIVDDHPGVRTALASLLCSSDALCLVGSACSGEEALELAAALCPAVIVMDLAMPGLGGVEAIRRIRAFQTPSPVVVALSGSRELMRDAVAAGAAVTVLKDEDPQRLLEVIAAAPAG